VGGDHGAHEAAHHACFTRDENGRRAIHGKREKFQTDPHWRDLILFYEYFNGDTGEGLGASHQTGWTGVVAKLIQQYAEYALRAHPEMGEEFGIGRVQGTAVR
jgi:hypothetical protein